MSQAAHPGQFFRGHISRDKKKAWPPFSWTIFSGTLFYGTNLHSFALPGLLGFSLFFSLSCWLFCLKMVDRTERTGWSHSAPGGGWTLGLDIKAQAREVPKLLCRNKIRKRWLFNIICSKLYDLAITWPIWPAYALTTVPVSPDNLWPTWPAYPLTINH